MKTAARVCMIFVLITAIVTDFAWSEKSRREKAYSLKREGVFTTSTAPTSQEQQTAQLLEIERARADDSALRFFSLVARFGFDAIYALLGAALALTVADRFCEKRAQHAREVTGTQTWRQPKGG
jgi:hypothetical protein